MSISIDIIPSKSYAHRQLVAAALSETPCSVVCDFASEDIEATRKCLAALEPSLSGRSGNKGLTASAPETDSICTLPCGESGSTLRFLLPLAGALGTKARFLTQGRLAERPMDPLRDELTVHGCSLSEPGVSPITIEGQLTPGTYMLPGNVSSQFITGLLLALPLLKKKSTLVVTGKLQSSPYIDITLDVLKQFGIQIEQEVRESGRTYEIPGNQHYQGPERVITEGDWSGAAFWLAAGAIGFRRFGIMVGGRDHCRTVASSWNHCRYLRNTGSGAGCCTDSGCCGRHDEDRQRSSPPHEGKRQDPVDLRIPESPWSRHYRRTGGHDDPGDRRQTAGGRSM